MARKTGPRSLGIWMNGVRVGTWSVTVQGRQEFQYDETWLTASESRPVSLSMPLAPSTFAYTGETVGAFFDNLLPDSADIRMRIRQRFSAVSLSPFDLLSEIGRDCVGALQLLPEHETPGDIRTIEKRPLTEKDVESILADTVTAAPYRWANSGSFRISIAGAQEKTALLYHKKRWYEPIGSTPTTHILKLPLGIIGTIGVDLSLSLENEWLCSRIAEAMGFAAAHCELKNFNETKALVIERFDRRFSPDKSYILRLPQEDMCQATGTAPSRKYEADGGPGISGIMKTLLGSIDPIEDRKRFFKTQLLFWLLAAPDGHAKNFSIFIEKGGRFRLTPLYDIMSAYPVLGRKSGLIAPEKLKMAMAVTGKTRHYEWRKIMLRHWRTTAGNCGISGEFESIIKDLLHEVPRAIQKVSSSLPEAFPDSIASPILDGFNSAALALESQL